MLDFEVCWAALERRDAGADRQFFYGVRTTGVYCRAGCTSRLPLRRNTMFFETTAAAESAGFRSCKRCRPTDESAASRHVAAIEKACALLRTSENIPSLGELADAAAISRFHFHRVFKQITGVTPRDYARSHRLGRFGEKLDSGQPIAASIESEAVDYRADRQRRQQHVGLLPQVTQHQARQAGLVQCVCDEAPVG